MTSERIHGHIAILAANVIFGVYIPMSKYLLSGYISGEMLTLFRMWGAAILFWVAGCFIKNDKVSLKDLGLMFFFSLTGIVFNQGLFIYGLDHTSPVDASVIVTATPLMVMVLSALFMRDPISGKKASGVLLGASGAIWLVLTARHAVSSSATPFGDIIILCSGLSSAIYFSLSKPLVARHSPIVVLKWMFLFAVIMLSPLTPSCISAPDAFKGGIGVSFILMMFFVVVAATFLTYLLMAYAIKRLRPTTLAMYNYVQPVVSSGVAIAIAQDVFSFEKILAAALVFTGVYLVTTSPRPPATLSAQDSSDKSSQK